MVWIDYRRKPPKERVPGVPVLFGIITRLYGRPPMILVFCPHCKIRHRHVWFSSGQKKGDKRFAKCTDPTSPLLDSGYYVEQTKDAEEGL